jgi:hypothetical protein
MVVLEVWSWVGAGFVALRFGFGVFDGDLGWVVRLRFFMAIAIN